MIWRFNLLNYKRSQNMKRSIWNMILSVLTIVNCMNSNVYMKIICVSSKTKSSLSKTLIKPKEAKSNNLSEKRPLPEVYSTMKPTDSKMKSMGTRKKFQNLIAYTLRKSDPSKIKFRKKINILLILNKFTGTWNPILTAKLLH